MSSKSQDGVSPAMRSILGDEMTGLYQIRGIWARPVPRPEALPKLEPTAFIATSKPSLVVSEGFGNVHFFTDVTKNADYTKNGRKTGRTIPIW